MEETKLVALRNLVARSPLTFDLREHANEQALRIIVRCGLEHPMTLAAAMKVVSTEMPHGRIAEIEATARIVHARLQRRRSSMPDH